ncbi:polysaccharide deacetylase family protein [Thermodesulfobacteriota bacterium]
MKIVFLIGNDNHSTRLSIQSVCKINGVEPVAVLLDTAVIPFVRRLNFLKKNIKINGIGYLPDRINRFFYESLELQAGKVVFPQKIDKVMHKTFPDYYSNIKELGKQFNFRIFEVNNLNSLQAAKVLQETGAELGVVLGTRILKCSTFSIPPKGCINLHKGKVPEYRGMPPGFWELHEGSKYAGITVHLVDDGLDTGDIISTFDFEINQNETLASLQYKLNVEGARLLANSIEDLISGNVKIKPQPPALIKPKTSPTRLQYAELMRKSPNIIRGPKYIKKSFKTLAYLFFLHSGIYKFARFWKKNLNISRARILLYHRVNNYSADPLTASTDLFAAHLLMLKRYYHVRSTSWLINSLTNNKPIPPDTIIIHFDDSYKDVFINAVPLLREFDMPATFFIATGFLGTNRAYAHDQKKYPFFYENMDEQDVRKIAEMGFEVGAHTVNHVDLGNVLLNEAEFEIFESRKRLEEITGRPIEFFSFPFGRLSNIGADAKKVIEDAGFRALFSAYGGTVTHKCSRYDIPRIGASGEHRPLDLMMEIEGISFMDFTQFLKKYRS